MHLPTDAGSYSAAVAAISLTLAVVTGSVTLAYPGGALLLTIQAPFSNWPAVGALFQVPVVSGAQAFAAGVAHTAWCDLPSVRPGVTVWTRSPACACLGRVVRDFLSSAGNNTSAGGNASLSVYAWNNASFNVSAAAQAQFPGEAVACMRHRATWQVWQAYKVHPAATALFCNLSLGVLALAVTLCRAGRSWGRHAALAVGLGGCVALGWADALDNSLLIVGLLVICITLYLTVDLELTTSGTPGGYTRVDPVQPEVVGPVYTTADQTFMAPEPLLVCLYWQMPLCVSAIASYLVAALLVRDAVGMLAVTGLAYAAGLAGQRLWWARVYMRRGAWVDPLDAKLGAAWKVTRSIELTFGVFCASSHAATLIALCAALALMLANTWYHGPYWSAYGGLLALLVWLAIPLVDAFDRAPPGYMRFENKQRIEACVALAANALFSVCAVADSLL